MNKYKKNEERNACMNVALFYFLLRGYNYKPEVIYLTRLNQNESSKWFLLLNFSVQFVILYDIMKQRKCLVHVVRLIVCPFISLSAHTMTLAPVPSLACSFVLPSVSPLILYVASSFVYLFIHSFIYSFFYLFIHLFYIRALFLSFVCPYVSWYTSALARLLVNSLSRWLVSLVNFPSFVLLCLFFVIYWRNISVTLRRWV